MEQTSGDHFSPLDDAREQLDRVNARAGRNLPAAIGVGLLLIAWVVLSLLYFVPGFVVLVVVCIVFSSIELHRALEMAGRGRSTIVPIAVGGALTAVGGYLAAGRTAEDALLLVMTPMALTSVVALGWRLRKGPVDYVKDVSASLLAIAYVTLLGAFLPLAVGESHGNLRIAAMILCVVASDVGGYVAGVTIGRHKLAPMISPKKTWEGVGGSVVLALVVGWVTVDVLLGGSLWAGLLFGLAMVVVGTVGDLVESMVKRDLGIKDMSSFLPGHGGFLDRIDAILYAAPVGWLLLRVLVPYA
ncbi:MAG: phosphatidate cytidylyltransferase [Propionibacteriaceae bacterium]